MSKNILVAGGAGFLGSHLVDRLLQDEENYVIVVDNFVTGAMYNLPENKKLHVLSRNIQKPCDFKIWDSILEIDEVYNLACPASPVHYRAMPIETMLTCVVGTKNLLDLSLANDAKMMQASTSEVYGDPEEHPQKETYWGNVNPIGPRACYDEGKRAAETLCFDYHRNHGVDLKVARIFNTYGPRMRSDDGRVVSNFIVQALNDDPITIYGTGKQTRSFCYVDDLIDGFMAMMDTEKGNIGPWNLGNPTEFEVLELAELVIDMIGSKSEIVFCPLPKDDPKFRRPDIYMAKKSFGFDPKIPLGDGLMKTIEYFERMK